MADASWGAAITAQEVRVGDLAGSTLSIEIRSVSGPNASYALYIVVPWAFVPAEAAARIVFAGFDATRNDVVQPDDGTRWRIGDKRGTSIDAGKSLAVTLASIAAASPGTQTVQVEWRRGPTAIGTAALPVTVLAADDVPKIISFEARSHALTRTPTGNAPVELRWEADAESVVMLSRLGETLLPRPGDDSAPRMQREWWRDEDSRSLASGIQPYQLTASAKGRTVSRWLFVRMQDAGWNRIEECRQGAPTLLVSDGDNALYGVFRRHGAAAVYQLATERGALGREDVFRCKVPEGMEDSPGAFFQNRIWLAGGSQIDPQACSNQVWWFDPRSGLSGLADAAEGSKMWARRMGHACAVFDGKLWVLGGVDENGNTLQDVWFHDGNNWRESQPLPKPLCLMAAHAFAGKLWVYGGIDAPFGAPQPGLYYFAREGDGQWHQMKFEGKIQGEPNQDPVGEPFASALCVAAVGHNDALCGLGTFQTVSGVSSNMFSLYGEDFKRDRASVKLNAYAITPANDWPTTVGTNLQQAFRLSAVRFKSYIFVVSLVYGGDSRSLSYLVL